jgi:glycosyltransferase involved in cell wall biosynthesis
LQPSVPTLNKSPQKVIHGFKRMKSVCLVVQNAYPADVRIRKYAQTLYESGHKVVVLASRSRGQRYHEIIEGVEVFRVPPGKRRAGKILYVFDYLAYFCFAFIQLNLLDLRRRFDVIHVNTLPDFLVFCASIQKIAGRAVILDMHEIMPEFFMSKYSVGAKSAIVRILLFIEKISMRFAGRTITVNHEIKRLLEKRVAPARPVTVIMNTVDGSVVKRHEFKTHSTFNCVYHGTLTDIYGLDVAIEGFARACGMMGKEKLCFHIFGNGPQINDLRNLAGKLGVADRTIFHGEIRFEKIWQNLAEMDLGILACRKDVFTDMSFSNKLAEYIYLKIPVIHSDLKSIQYYFNDREIKYFKAGDVKGLAEGICYAWKNGDAMEKRAKAAFEKYASIDWGIMSKRYLELIEGCDTRTSLNTQPTGVKA